MNTIRQYSWVIKFVGAALLIVLAAYLEFFNGESIVIPFVGAIIVLTSFFRLVPYIKTQSNDLVKTINVVEITIDTILGLTLIIYTIAVGNLEEVFGYILGVYLMLRGSVHFFSISTKDEESDYVLYFYHIAALIIGSYVFFSGNFTPGILIHIILVFSIVTGVYLTYDGYNGYKLYRYEKTDKSEKPIQDAEQELPPRDHVPKKDDKQDEIVS
ncbi:MAG: hypothetical protein K9L74_01180 [Candidatus Izimaplasma sp.]|nr:hypothetical protein [Candidatus Izimaplasma bacterium]